MDISGIKTGLNTRRLTQEILDEKFVEWNQTWGQGRDNQDMRFGQWIHQYYLVPESDSANDGFYSENSAEAYSQLHLLLEAWGW